jgi:hypothetical protein
MLSEPWAQVAAVVLAVRTAYAVPRGIHLFLAASADLLNDLRRHDVLGRDRRTGERRRDPNPIAVERRAGSDRRISGYRSRFSAVGAA